jgi:hypothetical protein
VLQADKIHESSLQNLVFIINLVFIRPPAWKLHLSPEQHPNGMKYLLLSFFLLGAQAYAATFNSTGSVSSIQVIHDTQAAPGDTITLPVGTFKWTTHLTLKKGITLEGHRTRRPFSTGLLQPGRLRASPALSGKTAGALQTMKLLLGLRGRILMVLGFASITANGPSSTVHCDSMACLAY